MRLAVPLALLLAALALIAMILPARADRTPEEARNVEIILDVFGAFGIDDLETLEQYFAVDGTVIIGLTTRPRGGPYDTFMEAAPFPGRLDNVTVEIESLIAEGDSVAIQSVICGDHVEPLLGFEPTGKPVCARYLNFYVLKDEKIISNSVGVQRDQLRDQLEANAAP